MCRTRKNRIPSGLFFHAPHTNMDKRIRAHVAKVIKSELRALLRAEVQEVRTLVREQQERRTREKEEQRVRAYANERLSTLLEDALGFHGEIDIFSGDDERLLRKHGYNVDEILIHLKSFNEKLAALIRELHPIVIRRGAQKNGDRGKS